MRGDEFHKGGGIRQPHERHGEQGDAAVLIHQPRGDDRQQHEKQHGRDDELRSGFDWYLR